MNFLVEMDKQQELFWLINHVTLNPTAQDKGKGSHMETVYSQQKQFFQSHGSNICPCKAMVQDLVVFLCSCKANGDQIVLFLDANEDMTNGYMQHMLSAEDLGMREAVLSSHPIFPKMATYMKGDKLGRNPIDGVWLTDDIPSIASGWLAFHKCPGDHQIAMVDIDSRVLLCEDLLCIGCPQVRRLSCCIPQAIPRAKKHYKRHVMSHFKRHKLLNCLHMIYANVNSPLTESQQCKIESIDKVQVKGMKYAEKKCR
jgi:hypothetical protein